MIINTLPIPERAQRQARQVEANYQALRRAVREQPNCKDILIRAGEIRRLAGELGEPTTNAQAIESGDARVLFP